MTFSDLRAQYTKDDLSYFTGDLELRYRLFAPFLENLFENKLVYKERFVCLVRLAELKITPEGFNATAIPYLPMDSGHILDVPCPTKPWTFGAAWDWMRLINNSINVPYAGFTIWPEYDRVREVERLLRQGSFEQASLLTVNEKEIA